MALYIRDEAAAHLASELQKMSKAPNETETVRCTLQHEIDSIRKEPLLRERVARIQHRLSAHMGSRKPDFDMKHFTDEM
ncbi:hypothetical protein B0E45_04680 [Sinorhizobium sp. A49]|uniref:type II toxin-antitoxin system VapB family antitoxin n=1 Tax=Sinorhizobium sp. A49 TaxID=1945861 RepID=UPI0009854C45|nr:type II toxin-antitoxin system VapB family antitoxin [Sinorhizobium sp. A49]OOG74703.1 hypothetical protein B0E45_04680 [Sinorhizobium sp. A49]